ncbi:MAG TPA: sugar ABC transporter ATP-binding protein [Nevskiaceae bacterium]
MGAGLTATVEARDAPAVLTIAGLCKAFGPTIALHDVSLEVKRGEVHALLGHNGSGKSTVVKIISGAVRADSGSVVVCGHRAVPQVGVVHQDLGLCGDATVVENCCMSGYRATRFGIIDWTTERRAVQVILSTLAADFGPTDLVRKLTPADQTIVAMARALKRADRGELDLLVLDEATARLRGRDADKALATARRVAEHGGGVLIVTHHMSEVRRAADRATVLRNGRLAGSVRVADTDEAGLLALCSGARVGATEPAASPRGVVAGDSRDVALRASGLRGARFSSDDAIEVRRGEIVGVTGAPGAGHEEIPYLVAGAFGRAQVAVFGQLVHGGSVTARRACGIGLVPAERLAQGILLRATVFENLSPVVRRRHTRARLVRARRERDWAQRVCEAFSVRPARPEAPIGSLSGGNQQKVLLARVLEDVPKVLVLHEPTEGVDEMTRRVLMDMVRAAAVDGMAVLYVSSDIDEVVECADRVLVVRDGAIVADLRSSPTLKNEAYAASYTDIGAGRERAA